MADDSSEVVKEQSESVAASNLKVLGDGPAFYTNMAYQQALDAQAGWRTINQAIVGKVAEAIISTAPGEGGADVAALQQLMKGAQTTPPVTP
jgi:hypothetical protein